MKAFAILLDSLLFTPSRNGKIQLLKDYFKATENPDRGYALAALTGELDLKTVKPALLRGLVEVRLDATLFRYSYDFVGDLAETISLVWPQTENTQKNYRLFEIIEHLQKIKRKEAAKTVETLLDDLSPNERYAFLKLVTGGLRVGVSARLAKTALAEFGDVDVSEIEELWHGLEAPYETLFSWLEGKAEKPTNLSLAAFNSVMLAHALEEKELEDIIPEAFAAEWKWDGIRIQLASENGEVKLYSRTGDDISNAFPDIAESIDFEGTFDGELLIAGSLEKGEDNLFPIADFGALQKRLNRKTVSKKMQEESPAIIRLYDYLKTNEEDLRPLPFEKRRERLERFFELNKRQRIDISPLVSFENFNDLKEFRKNPPDKMIEGLMLKRWKSPYLTGRPKGHWYKWKKEPYRLDAVLLYAQRGHGKRSGTYSDYTFALWTEDDVLVPVGKAYFGFTDEELLIIDKFVRDNTVERFGPVRSVRATPDFGFVFEVAFEGVNRSTRHKSGVALRFPRIARLRMDKLPKDADMLETLKKLL